MQNCTPHDIHVYNDEGTEIIETYPRSGHVLRLTEEPQKQIGELLTENGKTIPVVSQQEFGDVEGLPSCKDGHCPDILVSMLAALKLKETRSWPGAVFGPDTGKEAVRAENGQIIGTTRLIQYCARRALNM